MSSEDIALYDRQIRLWGTAAQEHHEVLKNLTLSGVGKITFLEEKDTLIVNEDILKSGSPFFYNTESIGKSAVDLLKEKLSILNPTVFFESIYKDKLSNEMLKSFSVILLCQSQFSDAMFWNERCRETNTKFYYMGIRGFIGFALCDYMSHEFFENSESKKNLLINYLGLEDLLQNILPSYICSGFLSSLYKKRKLQSYLNLFSFFTLAENEIYKSHKDSFIEQLEKVMDSSMNVQDHFKCFQKKYTADECIPLASIVGGHGAQDILRGISHQGKPIDNVLIYDAFDTSSMVFELLQPYSKSIPKSHSSIVHCKVIGLE